MKTTLTLAAAALLGGLALGSATTAAPLPMNGLQTGQSGVTQVAMMRGDRMMMKKHMMRKKMMKRRMMKKRMMNRM